MYNKKYIILSVLIAALLALISFAFLNKYKKAEIPMHKKLLYIKSSTVRSAAYAGCAAWVRLITENSDFIAVNSASPATMNDKINMLISGEIDAAFITGPSGYLAYNGHPDYWNKPQNIRALFGLWPAVYNSVAYKDSGIKSIKDLKGKRIAIYSDRSLDGDVLKHLLEINGINSYNSTIYRVRESIGEKMFSRKEVDFIWYNLGQGNSFLDKYSKDNEENTESIRLVPVTEKNKLREFLTRYPVFYTENINYEDTYEYTSQLVTSNFVACSADMPDDLAYKLTRLWWENTEYIKQFTSDQLEINSIINIYRGVPVPLHPGAEKYFLDADIPY